MGGLLSGEERGDRRRNRTAITIQDYVAWCSAPASSAGCVSRFWFGGSVLAGARSVVRKLSAFRPSRPEGRESSGRSIHGLPRSVLGFQDRGCPVKVSGSGARAACLSVLVVNPARPHHHHHHHVLRRPVLSINTDIIYQSTPSAIGGITDFSPAYKLKDIQY